MLVADRFGAFAAINTRLPIISSAICAPNFFCTSIETFSLRCTIEIDGTSIPMLKAQRSMVFWRTFCIPVLFCRRNSSCSLKSYFLESLETLVLIGHHLHRCSMNIYYEGIQTNFVDERIKQRHRPTISSSTARRGSAFFCLRCLLSTLWYCRRSQ